MANIMRIAVLGINYWPDETGIAPFNTGKCEYLASCGHEVTAFTGLPYYPAWKVPDGYRGRFLIREHRAGVTIVRSWLYVPKRLNSVKRIIHEASFVASAFLRSIGNSGKKRPDVLIVITPPLALGLAAFLLSRKWKVPYVQHVADLQPDAAVDLGMLSPTGFTRLLYAIERLSYQKAAIISTLTVSMRERIVGKGIASDKVILSPDWARPELFSIPRG
jgi:putative colanic acid biosynthesis glycosyltransferase WcaI